VSNLIVSKKVIGKINNLRNLQINENNYFFIRFRQNYDADCFVDYDEPITKNLKILPSFVDHPTIKNGRNIKGVVLYFGKAKHIFAGIGESFPNLANLWIHDPSLRVIERRDFVGLSNLKILNLIDKEIDFLPEDVFWDLPNLVYLNLSKGKISKLHKNMFKNMKNLRKFDFGLNKLKHIDKDLFDNNLELEDVEFRSNLLKTVEFDFRKLTKLKDISFNLNDCIDKRFTSLQPIFSTNPSVEALQKIIDENCR
jgi:Leucine-rich repeat (LRR) protein